jgi:hypothetical protein
MNLQHFTVGLDSAVGTATCYGLKGPGIENRWGRDFTLPSRTALGLTQPHVQYKYRVKFSEVMRLGRGDDQPPNLAPRLKKEYSCFSTPTLILHGPF